MNYTRGTHCFITWKKQLFKWIEPFINIDNSLFVNNIGLLRGGESQTSIDEMLSVSIRNTKFISHDTLLIISYHAADTIIFLFIEYMFLLNLWSRCLCSLCLFHCLSCCGYCIYTSALHK
eukprot:253578_1